MHVGEVSDWLQFAIDFNLKVIGFQVGDLTPLRIGNHSVDLDQRGADAKYGGWFLRLERTQAKPQTYCPARHMCCSA
jgi:hypothetical protein